MRIISAIIASMLLAGCTKAADKSHDQKAVIDAVTAANFAKDRAMIRRDPQALASFYTEDYQVIDSQADVHGKENQVDFMTRSVELLNAGSDQVKVEVLSPDAALVTGRMTGRYRMDGKETNFVERYTGIWVRQGDRWRVKHEHGSMQPDETTKGESGT